MTYIISDPQLTDWVQLPTVVDDIRQFTIHPGFIISSGFISSGISGSLGEQNLLNQLAASIPPRNEWGHGTYPTPLSNQTVTWARGRDSWPTQAAGFPILDLYHIRERTKSSMVMLWDFEADAWIGPTENTIITDFVEAFVPGSPEEELYDFEVEWEGHPLGFTGADLIANQTVFGTSSNRRFRFNSMGEEQYTPDRYEPLGGNTNVHDVTIISSPRKNEAGQLVLPAWFGTGEVLSYAEDLKTPDVDVLYHQAALNDGGTNIGGWMIYWSEDQINDDNTDVFDSVDPNIQVVEPGEPVLPREIEITDEWWEEHNYPTYLQSSLIYRWRSMGVPFVLCSGDSFGMGIAEDIPVPGDAPDEAFTRNVYMQIWLVSDWTPPRYRIRYRTRDRVLASIDGSPGDIRRRFHPPKQ